MDFDDLACNRHDTFFILWRRNLETYAPERLAAKLAISHCNRTAIDAQNLSEGSYNRCFRVKFDQGPDAVVRFTALGRSFFRKEKVDDEVALMNYLYAKHPAIPLPKVWGKGWCAVGPYIVMEFIEGTLLTKYLEEPNRDRKLGTILNPSIGVSTLRKGYREMARLLLAMFDCKFSRIGAVGEDGSVTKRAVTFNMNELVGLANYPPKEFATHTFSTASDYFVSLANDHLTHLKMQRNDAISDAEDCREKYIARCLFRKICHELYTSPYNEGPFTLFCDDFRPSNVISDEDLNIKSVIDWEYCYSAPVEFAHCSPWWLLLARPDDWEDGPRDFMAQYLPRHRTFLEILRECEDEIIREKGMVSHGQKRLSEHMQESIDNGLFWFCLTAKSSYGFDKFYWRFVDERFFGKFTNLEQRLELLSEEERNNLEPFVQFKLQQEKEKKLDEHRTLDEILES
ncbi:hypothetical protein PRK78_005190 [Emydomyces testavorans]|uniref:Aminoglycoside phosphotransferase domain-containing protein n=1 Tax=Emydomyces testavorans TaxID=2070801 RepID=A0AAF0IJA2_9EURO|nr:hypothetical protein PRK78_005190 [Emydomyces testavorans]